MARERPFPKLPLSRAILVVIAFAAVAGLCAWFAVHFQSQVLRMVLFLAPLIVAYFYYYRRRCPECRGRLTFRRDYIGSTQRYRALLDCPRCQIAWDTGDVGDEGDTAG